MIIALIITPTKTAIISGGLIISPPPPPHLVTVTLQPAPYKKVTIKPKIVFIL
jgi:hypothetical protein